MDSARTCEKFAPKSTTKLIAATLTGKKQLFIKVNPLGYLCADKG